MTQENEEVMARIRVLVASSGLSYDELARRCNVSGMTVRRVLNDDAKNPSFFLLCDIITVCGGSVDAILGIAPHTSSQLTVSNEPLEAQLRAEAQRDRYRAEKYGRIITVLVVFLFAVLVVSIIDLLNPNVGWIRRTALQQAQYGLDTGAFIMCMIAGWLG